MSQQAIDFGVKVLTEEGQKVIDGLQFLYTPAEGSVSFLNDTDHVIEVKTYDEKDAVRWVAYEERKIAPRQVVQLTARGKRIHIVERKSGCTFDCEKGTAYLFDGTNVHKKVIH
ncbi:hypothetical protein [Gilvimarinus agarilyticus]|uniref:hypothetical protein n=1 Tax=Gilvimarinus agarilyticus TaxID=679259 RepID=UPI0005A2731D|nr:hypothetical protein [Gilvimarinus agarilyticus]